MGTSGLIYWFDEVRKDDVNLVGGKGANLGEMVHAGLPVPAGFIVSAKAYFQFIKENNLAPKIKSLLATVNYDRQDSLRQVATHIQELIRQGALEKQLIYDINTSYKRLGNVLASPRVAVRSSATAEDLPSASFAGQQETYLNVEGEANLVQKIREAWASLFEARAIFYRHEQQFDHFRVGIAVVVQKMIESEESGIMFTIDPVTNDKTKLVIEAIYGLGELIVQGAITPDHYEISKQDLVIRNKSLARQEKMLAKSGSSNREVAVPLEKQEKQKISDHKILELAALGKKLERHYFFPQDIEWAIENNTVYIVQTRAITTVSSHKKVEGHLDKDLPLLISGAPASPGIASGPARVIQNAREIGKVLPGEVLVAPQTNPDYVPAMKKAVAIVTERGGRTSHAAIVSRELGIPAIVGAEGAVSKLPTGTVVTVDGGTGNVYKGGAFTKHEAPETEKQAHLRTATKVYVNLAQPELAPQIAQENVDGVGLLRAEFMMADIGTHPKKFIKDGKQHVYVETLAKQLSRFCESFSPRPVVYRTSDFKSNEYRNLEGGKEFEPIEPNPMLGFRGVFRYLHDPEVFELELEAIKHVRHKLGLKNLWLMLPFVRSVRELIEIKQLIAASGLHRSPSFKLWMMVELPVNVVLLDKFIEAGIDGVSIVSNDLTMLMLGTDRDNSEVSRAYDEQNESVLWAFEHVIKTAHKFRVTSSICGQAPSLYPSLLEKLVRWGISSVSVSPDAIETTREHIAAVERHLVLGK